VVIGYVFTRAAPGPSKPGTWRPLKDGTRLSASISCPRCGALGTLLDHEIHDKGIVTPSIVCPDDECGFHEMAKLEGWA
jgi:hypothetical protein